MSTAIVLALVFPASSAVAWRQWRRIIRRRIAEAVVAEARRARLLSRAATVASRAAALKLAMGSCSSQNRQAVEALLAEALAAQSAASSQSESWAPWLRAEMVEIGLEKLERELLSL